MKQKYRCDRLDDGHDEPSVDNSQDLLSAAISHYGIAEIPGAKHDPLLLKWTKKLFPWATDDNIAWCSIFINAMALDCGMETVDDDKPGLARSWLDVGVPVDHPVPGDVVIFWRKSKQSQYGHVGLYCNEQGDYINVLGGNQGDKVQISKYPKYRLLGYRRLRKKYVS